MKKTILLNQREVINVISESVRHILLEIGGKGYCSDSYFGKKIKEFLDNLCKSARNVQETAANVKKEYERRIRRQFVYNGSVDSIPTNIRSATDQIISAPDLIKVGINPNGTFTVFLLRPREIRGGAGSSW